MSEVKRLNILACYKCGKIIGTRENYYEGMMKEKRLFRKPIVHTIAFCEGCIEKND